MRRNTELTQHLQGQQDVGTRFKRRKNFNDRIPVKQRQREQKPGNKLRTHIPADDELSALQRSMLPDDAVLW